ncbi:MAG: chemotaxis protein CheW [Gammaproteobacteria bacterium]|nr:chemotaxis protein CheW [Gammaproteobacteria bacterium]
MNDTATQTEQRDAQLVMLDQQLALGAYLHALLKPPVETVSLETAPVETVTVPADAAPVAASVVALAVAEAVPAAVSESIAIPPPAIAVVPEKASPYSAPYPASCPDWAAGEFECLLFRVAGLTLALPLAKLNGVLPWDAAAVTVTPGHSPWLLGLRDYQGQKVRLIDVANVIVPRDGPASEGNFGKVILIGGGRWGLVCDALAEIVTLAPAAVKWRGRAGGNRPWLAGTVIERMCALIDADAFAEMLGAEVAPTG